MQNSNARIGSGLVIATLLALAMTTLAAPASAQEVQITGPLAGQPAVRHMRVFREGRFNLVPGVGYTLQDEFARALYAGLEANYHFLDWLGIGIWGGYNVAEIDTDLTTQVGIAGQTTDRNRLSLPDHTQFSRQIGRQQWAVSAHLIFVPLRGKLSLFQAVFVDTDLYIFAGIGIFGVTERANYTGADCQMAGADGLSTPQCVATQSARASRVLPAPMFGIGMSLYVNSWFGIALEWRGFPFAWNPSGTDESGEDAQGNPGSGFPDGAITDADQRTTFNHMFNVGLIFNLPPEQRVSE